MPMSKGYCKMVYQYLCCAVADKSIITSNSFFNVGKKVSCYHKLVIDWRCMPIGTWQIWKSTTPNPVLLHWLVNV